MTTNVLLRIFNIINFFFSRCRLYPFSLDLIPCSLSIVKLAKGGVLSLLQILVLCYIKSWTHISHTLKPSFFHSGINAEKRRPSTDITSTLRQKHQIERFSKSTDTLEMNIFFCCCLFLSFGLILPNLTRMRNILYLQIYYWTLNRLPVATFNQVVIVSSINSYRFNLRTSTS